LEKTRDMRKLSWGLSHMLQVNLANNASTMTPHSLNLTVPTY
jgi:hypothetical protein